MTALDLWREIGVLAVRVLEADAAVAALPVANPDHQNEDEAATLRAVAASEDLGVLLVQAGLEEGGRQLVRLPDGRLVCLVLLEQGVLAQGAPFGQAAVVPSKVIDLRAPETLIWRGWVRGTRTGGRS